MSFSEGRTLSTWTARVPQCSRSGGGRGGTSTTTTASSPCSHSSLSRPARAGSPSSKTPCPPHIKMRDQFLGFGQSSASSTLCSLLSSLSFSSTSLLPSSSSPSMSWARLSSRMISIKIRSPASTLPSKPGLYSSMYRMKHLDFGKFFFMIYILTFCPGQLPHLETCHFTAV